MLTMPTLAFHSRNLLIVQELTNTEVLIHLRMLDQKRG